jgi:hypothetical protein
VLLVAALIAVFAVPSIPAIVAQVAIQFTKIQADNEPPTVTNPSAVPLVIPDDTDNEPLWRELAELMVNVTDENEIATVTIDLAALGWEVSPVVNQSRCQQYGICDPSVAVLACIGNHSAGSTTWVLFNLSSNASTGTTGWNGSGYVPFCLPINATDIYGNTNTSVGINLTVVTNGDVSGNGLVTLYDASYISKWYLGKEGFETLIEGVADVSGNGLVTLYDASYISKWYLGIEGFEVRK